LGVVPFLVFTLAPLVFGSERMRRYLLVTLVATGLYLGTTALLETLHLWGLVFPTYIRDASIGIHFGRARGPFLEGVGNGLAMYECGVASILAAWTWRTRPWARNVAILSAVLCLAGTVFTLTRAIWLATVVASLATLVLTRRTRAALGPAAILSVLVVSAALVFIPGLANRAEQRSGDQRPIWDRYNTNVAGVRAVEKHPLFGIGFERWKAESHDYLRLSPDYPLTGTRIEIHNVALGHAAELGLVGAGLWAMCMALGVGGAILRPGPADLDPWRLAMIAIALHWAIVASFGPLTYAFPNLLLWAWAGICSIGHLSQPLDADRSPAHVGA
jgi:O-antigen ligase